LDSYRHRIRFPGGLRTESPLALLHPDGLTLFEDGQFTRSAWTHGGNYTCIAGDSEGNLWLGSKGGGVIRVFPDLKIKTYTRGDINLESNKITAITASPEPTPGGGIAVWVACDRQRPL